MYDLITIGSATLDIVVKSPDFHLTEMASGGIALCERLGGKMDVDTLRMISGGGATNVAVGCARMGLRSAVVAEVGHDFPAQMIFAELEREGVETKFIVTERMEETAVSVLLVAGNGGRTIMTHRGAAYELENRDLPWDSLTATRWIHLGGVGGEKPLLFDLFDYLQHKEIGLSWTPSPKDLAVFARGELLVESIRADVMILNQEEWQTCESIQDSLRQQIPVIVVTKGKEGGTVYIQSEKSWQFVADDVQSIEETGAGDAFTSGFVSGVLLGKTIPECVGWGKRNATSVIQALGAKEGLLTREQVRG